jgi:iron(III) transport system substrate-binding protein
MLSQQIRRAVFAAAFLATVLLSQSWISSVLAQEINANAQTWEVVKNPAADRTAKLMALSKAEGSSVTIYTSIAEKDLRGIFDPFEKKYGIHVNIWRASGDSCLARTITEARGHRYTVDVFHAGAVELEALHREKLLQAVASPHFSDLMPGSLPAHKEWASTLFSLWVQAYNTNVMKKADLPSSYEDLLDPRFKGKLGYEVENIDWFVTVVKAMGETKGLQYFRDLVSKNGITVRKGHFNLTAMVASGDVPMALTVYNYMPENFKKQGAPIDYVVLQPAVARTNGVAVLKNAPHPASAALLMDYLLGEGQESYVKIDYIASNTKYPSALRKIKMNVVDPNESLDQRDKWKRLYDEIIIKGNKP